MIDKDLVTSVITVHWILVFRPYKGFSMIQKSESKYILLLLAILSGM